MATSVETALAVTQDALVAAARGAPSSALLDQAIRVARLRCDGESLAWLTLEARSFGDSANKQRVWEELTQLLPTDRVVELHRAEVESYIEVRQATVKGEERLIALSVGEMEARIENLSRLTEIPPNLPPDAVTQIFDERSDAMVHVALLREVLARIRNRLVEFLTKTETQLLLDVTVSGIFEQNRIYVDGRLAKPAPEAAAKLLSAYRRTGEDDHESRRRWTAGQ